MALLAGLLPAVVLPLAGTRPAIDAMSELPYFATIGSITAKPRQARRPAFSHFHQHVKEELGHRKVTTLPAGRQQRQRLKSCFQEVEPSGSEASRPITRPTHPVEGVLQPKRQAHLFCERFRQTRAANAPVHS